ncbi:DUF2971 domain-containing protein [Paraferrimonas sp. SM1919]|uniref:DUF2971 domain-containing protein n=1 Tax=Paraferrimonas sp. SM1919 TaxID=2662263 RepID=UPI0013D53882|nr:DUF2971 domain-containing protein [Paraferrimonas sp. SM1919]
MDAHKFIKELFSSQIFKETQQLNSNLVQGVDMPLPQKLYHYTSAEGLKGIINSESLWATDCRFLNDSTEFHDGLSFTIEELAKRNSTLCTELSEYLKSDTSNFLEVVTPYITSFCADGDLLSQWRGYSSSSEGYCIEFDFSDSDLWCYNVTYSDLIPVIYAPDKKIKAINSIIDRIIEIFENAPSEEQSNKNLYLPLLANSFRPLLASFKNESFSEEKEIRAIFSLHSVQNEKYSEFRISNGAFIPYLIGSFKQATDKQLFKRAQLPITKIILPPSAGETARKGLELFLDSSGYSRKLITSSKIPLRNQYSISW